MNNVSIPTTALQLGTARLNMGAVTTANRGCWTTYRCLKVLTGLGTSILVGCAAPVPSPMPPPASPAPLHVVFTQPVGSQAAVQAITPTASDISAIPDDQTQVPLAAEAPRVQRGLASWYGKRFNGRRTASGERFSASGFTAAHRTLPMPSYLRVRRVANGQEVIVRVNDRGPHHPGRMLDLSLAAAKKLGIVALGSAEVEIELLTSKPVSQGDGK